MTATAAPPATTLRTGATVWLTGVDDTYEPPVSPELRVQTRGPVADSAAEVLELLRQKGIGILR